MKQISSISDIDVSFDDRLVKGKVVSITSTFKHNIDTFFAQELIKSNTQQIVKPLAKIRFIKQNEDSKNWQEGFTYELEIKPYGLFNLWGIHYIHIIEIDDVNKKIITQEKNTICKVWNHELVFEKINVCETNYTDQVILYAGKLTKVLSWFLVYSYKKRHKNWNRLLNKLQKT